MISGFNSLLISSCPVDRNLYTGQGAQLSGIIKLGQEDLPPQMRVRAIVYQLVESALCFRERNNSAGPIDVATRNNDALQELCRQRENRCGRRGPSIWRRHRGCSYRRLGQRQVNSSSAAALSCIIGLRHQEIISAVRLYRSLL